MNAKDKKRRIEMEKIFDLNNPVWKFIGNLWDFFVLSVLTVLCSLPVVTAGAALTALYYVTLKMASDEEGKVVPQFWQAFRGNLRQVTPAWILLLLIGAVLGIDFLYGLTGGTNFASAMLIVSGICLVLYGCVLLMSLVLFARVRNTTRNILMMAGAMAVRNFLPAFSAFLVMLAFVLVGLFVFWPVLLVTPGLPAYLSSRLYNRILQKYGFSLDLVDEEEDSSFSN